MTEYRDIGFVLNRLCMTIDLLNEEGSQISPQDLDEMEKHLQTLLSNISKLRLK